MTGDGDAGAGGGGGGEGDAERERTEKKDAGEGAVLVTYTDSRPNGSERRKTAVLTVGPNGQIRC